MNTNLIKFITSQSSFEFDDYTEIYGTYEFSMPDTNDPQIIDKIQRLKSKIHKNFNDLRIYEEYFSNKYILIIEE